MSVMGQSTPHNKPHVALITGGLSGIGLESASMLLERSVHVAAVSSQADQHLEAQSRLTDMAKRHGAKVVFIALDLRDADRVSTGYIRHHRKSWSHLNSGECGGGLSS